MNFGNSEVILDDQDSMHLGLPLRSVHLSPISVVIIVWCRHKERSSTTVKHAPPSSLSSKVISPPCSWHSRLTSAKPIPRCLPGLVEKPSAKIASPYEGNTPGPLSSTSISSCSPRSVKNNPTRPLSPAA